MNDKKVFSFNILDNFLEKFVYWFKYISYLFMLLVLVMYLFYMFFEEFLSNETLLFLNEFIYGMNIFMLALYIFLILALHDETDKIKPFSLLLDIVRNSNVRFKRYTMYLVIVRIVYIFYFPYMFYFLIMF